MELDDAFEKIKKCLRLSKSSNEHEAAAALRQARALMDKYGITDEELALADIEEAKAPLNTKGNPPAWTTALVNVIIRFFHCDAVFEIGFDLGPGWAKKSKVTFYGLEPQASIAGYAFDVLYRQLYQERQRYLANLSKRIKRANRTARADAFAEGWVGAVWNKVAAFAGEMSEQTRHEITAYIENKHQALTTTTPRSAADRRGVRGLDEAHDDGFRKGRDVNLNHGVGGSDSTKALGADA